MYSKHRLWLIINSLENIPSIDNRLLYADTLDSLNRNVYNLKLVQIPDLNNVYERNYNELKQLLYQKYLDIIKDTEAGLADLIMQDLMDKYQSQIVDSYTVYISPSNFMIGGENDGKASASRSGAPSRASKMPSAVDISKPPTLLPTGAPPPPPPPPQQFSKADYDRLKAMPESKLTVQQLRNLREYEIKTKPIVYTGKTVFKPVVKSSTEAHQDVLRERLDKIRKRTMRSASGTRNLEKLPELVESSDKTEYIGLLDISLEDENKPKLLPTSSTKVIEYPIFANKIRENILTVRPKTILNAENKLKDLANEIRNKLKGKVQFEEDKDKLKEILTILDKKISLQEKEDELYKLLFINSEKYYEDKRKNKNNFRDPLIDKTLAIIQENNFKYIQYELINLIKDVNIFLNMKSIDRSHDSKMLINKFNILTKKLNENEIPLWRYNYEIINNILDVLRPPHNIELFSKPKFDEYKNIVLDLAGFNKSILNDNQFNNTFIKFFNS